MGNLFTSHRNVSFSRRALLHGFSLLASYTFNVQLKPLRSQEVVTVGAIL
jgi:hypothetical protein